MSKGKKKVLGISIGAVLVVALIIGTIFLVKNKLNGDKEKDDVQVLPLRFEAELVDEHDEDGDGLTNAQEKEYGTDLFSIDTDEDLLTDADEVTMKTNPLKEDTDGDGIEDGIEVLAKLDPLKEVSNEDNGKDKKQTFNYTVRSEDNNCELNMTGNATVYTVTAKKVDNSRMENVPGVASGVYDFNIIGEFEEAEATIKFDKDIVEARGYDVDKMSIYYLKDDGSWEKVKSEYNGSDGVTAKLDHFSKYFVADSTIISEEGEVEVYILLDNSGSMYPKSVVSSSDENDVDFKRLDFATGLIDKLGNDASCGVGKFTGDFTDLSGGISSDNEALKEKIESIRTMEENFNGTAINESVYEAMKLFDTTNSSRKFIILLTDGKEAFGLLDMSTVSSNQAIKSAKEKGVSIITVALGDDCDQELMQNLSRNTGGISVYAKNADALDTVYEAIMGAINRELKDTDGDGKEDAVLVADNGFDVKRDGFSFSNYIVKYTMPNGEDISSEGQCFGMAVVAQLYYAGKLPIKAEEVAMHAPAVSDITPFKYFAQKVINHELGGPAYDISSIEELVGDGTEYCSSDKNLYDYKIYNKHVNEIIDELKDMDLEERYEKDDDEYHYSEEAQEEYDDKALIDEYLSYNVSDELKEKGIDAAEILCYNIEDSADSKKLTEDEQEDLQFLRMIAHYFTTQGSDKLSYYELTSDASNSNFEKLQSDLLSGKAVVIVSAGHAVNGIKLYELADGSGYQLMVYDNNYPGEEKSIKFVKKYKALGGNTVRIVEYYELEDTDGVFTKKGGHVPIFVGLYND